MDIRVERFTELYRVIAVSLLPFIFHNSNYLLFKMSYHAGKEKKSKHVEENDFIKNRDKKIRWNYRHLVLVIKFFLVRRA